MMTRGRGGVTIPPKNDDVIYEQPLKHFLQILSCQLVGDDKIVPKLVNWSKAQLRDMSYSIGKLALHLLTFLDNIHNYDVKPISSNALCTVFSGLCTHHHCTDTIPLRDTSQLASQSLGMIIDHTTPAIPC